METCEWVYEGSCTFAALCGSDYVIEGDEPTNCYHCGRPIEMVRTFTRPRIERGVSELPLSGDGTQP